MLFVTPLIIFLPGNKVLGKQGDGWNIGQKVIGQTKFASQKNGKARVDDVANFLINQTEIVPRALFANICVRGW